MALSNDLLTQFAKVIKPEEKKSSGSTVYGTVVEYNGEKYVKLDGSDLLTPVNTTSTIEPDEITSRRCSNPSPETVKE